MTAQKISKKALVREENTRHIISVAEICGYSNMDIFSGAGHDACYLAEIAPAGMIFIPCEDGISHNEIENVTPQDCEAGCNVLLHAMLKKAGGSNND